MPDFKLSYFNFHGGRGEAARLAMHLGGLEFEDHRIDYQQWHEHKMQMPFQAVPVLSVNGHKLTQSNAINRYIGKQTGLYPTDDFQEALVDEVMDAIEDVTYGLVVTMSMSDEEEKKQAREKLAAGPLPMYLGILQSYLQERGDYFADNKLTIADLKVFIWVNWLRSKTLDYIPADLVDKASPLLVKHAERMAAHPGIKAYYEKFGNN